MKDSLNNCRAYNMARDGVLSERQLLAHMEATGEPLPLQPPGAGFEAMDMQ